MNAREEILGRIGDLRHGHRGKTKTSSTSQQTSTPRVPWVYGQATPMEDVLSRFVDRCEDYRARVERVPHAGVAETIAKVLRDMNVRTAVIPVGLDQGWVDAIASAAIEVVKDEPPRTAAELDAIDAVVTASSVGIAETGTVVLTHGPDQGRRALSLVPDLHVCVVEAAHVVSDVPEATTLLKPYVLAGRPLTWISGPSATSDIELSRVEGVHGPRTLIIILAE